MAQVLDPDAIDDPLAGTKCPKCGAEKIKDTGKRHVFPNGDEAWVLECEECGYVSPVGHFKRARRGMPRPRRSFRGH